MYYCWRTIKKYEGWKKETTVLLYAKKNAFSNNYYILGVIKRFWSWNRSKQKEKKSTIFSFFFLKTIYCYFIINKKKMLFFCLFFFLNNSNNTDNNCITGVPSQQLNRIMTYHQKRNKSDKKLEAFLVYSFSAPSFPSLSSITFFFAQWSLLYSQYQPEYFTLQ